ncbi:hypothetical protein D3C85_1663210 [compost metagenome]
MLRFQFYITGYWNMTAEDIQNGQVGTVPCGSEPAREFGVSVDIDFECQSAFASRLAPTGGLCTELLFGSRGIEFNGCINQRRQCLFIDLLTFVDIDGTPCIAFKACIEQLRRIVQ